MNENARKLLVSRHSLTETIQLTYIKNCIMYLWKNEYFQVTIINDPSFPKLATRIALMRLCLLNEMPTSEAQIMIIT